MLGELNVSLVSAPPGTTFRSGIRKVLLEPDISVGSSSEYDRLIATIRFSNVLGVIVSQERARGDFDLSFHSFAEHAKDSFSDERNLKEQKLPLKDLLQAIEIAKSKLIALTPELSWLDEYEDRENRRTD
ncbi:MAG: hypothetical protein AAGL49_03090 [Pseudomonadota bacterium]